MTSCIFRTALDNILINMAIKSLIVTNENSMSGFVCVEVSF